MAPKKLEKKLRKEEKVKKAITIEKKKEIVWTYESGVRVTNLANMYSMSKSTISTILQRKDLYKEASVAKRVTKISGRLSLGVSERFIGISIIYYGKNSLDLRPTWVTTSPLERTEFVSQGPTVTPMKDLCDADRFWTFVPLPSTASQKEECYN